MEQAACISVAQKNESPCSWLCDNGTVPSSFVAVSKCRQSNQKCNAVRGSVHDYQSEWQYSTTEIVEMLHHVALVASKKWVLYPSIWQLHVMTKFHMQGGKFWWLIFTEGLGLAVVYPAIVCTHINSALQKTTEFLFLYEQCSLVTTTDGQTTTGSRTPGTFNSALIVTSFGSRRRILVSTSLTYKWVQSSTRRVCNILVLQLQRETKRDKDKGIIKHHHRQICASPRSPPRVCRRAQFLQKDSVHWQYKG